MKLILIFVQCSGRGAMAWLSRACDLTLRTRGTTIVNIIMKTAVLFLALCVTLSVGAGVIKRARLEVGTTLHS